MMDKKNIILLVIAIIILILSIIFLVFTNSKNENNQYVDVPKTTKKEEKELSFSDSKDKEYKLSDFSDKPIALIFWNSDSENSLETIELVQKNYDMYSNSVNILVINTNEPNSDIKTIVNAIIENDEITIPIYYDYDCTAQDLYYLEKLPTLVFINSDGSIENTVISSEEGRITEDSYLANLDIISHNY